MTLTWEMEMEGDRELLKRAFGRTPDCPSLPDLVANLERGDASAREHAAACPHCASEVKLYNQFMSPSLDKEEDAAVAWVQRNLRNPAEAQTPWWKPASWLNVRTLLPFGMAAAAILVAIGVQDGVSNTPLKPIIDTEQRSSRVELVGPKGIISGTPETFSWKAVPGAASYHVTLMEVDKTVVWESTSAASPVTLPAAVRQKALPGKRLIWTVDAMDLSGKAIASGSQDFRQQLKSSE